MTMDQHFGHIEVVRVPKVALVGLIATLVRPQLPGVLAERAATKMIDQLVNQSARLIAEQDRWATEKAVRQFLLPGNEPQPSEDDHEGPPRPLPHVIPGMQLGDEHRWILARYEKQFGRLDPGTTLTAAHLNKVVDWWNAGAAAAAGMAQLEGFEGELREGIQGDIDAALCGELDINISYARAALAVLRVHRSTRFGLENCAPSCSE